MEAYDSNDFIFELTISIGIELVLFYLSMVFVISFFSSFRGPWRNNTNDILLQTGEQVLFIY